MRNGTKIGLALIAFAWFATSTWMSMHAVSAAHRSGAQVQSVTMPCVWRGLPARLPTDA